MDCLHTAMEIGICQTICCIADAASEEPSFRTADFIPSVSEEELALRVDYIVDSLIDTRKEQFLLLGPELQVLEAFAKKGFRGKISVCLAHELNEQTKERIKKNTPAHLDVAFIDEGDFPPCFLPSSSSVVAFGFGGANTATLPGFQDRQLKYYRNFAGSIILACIAPAEQGERPLGWLTSSTFELFTAIIC